MVLKASELFPEPERPVMTVIRPRGISRVMFLRLCSRAPRTRRKSGVNILMRSPEKTVFLPVDIVGVGVVGVVVKPTGFLAGEGALDHQVRHGGDVAQLQKGRGQKEAPVVFPDLLPEQ